MMAMLRHIVPKRGRFVDRVDVTVFGTHIFMHLVDDKKRIVGDSIPPVFIDLATAFIDDGDAAFVSFRNRRREPVVVERLHVIIDVKIDPRNITLDIIF